MGDDIYEVMTQIVQLVFYQIAEDFNKPEPVQVMPDYYYPTPSMLMRSRSQSSRVRASKMKKSRKVRPRARPSPPMYGRQGPYNQDLAGILNAAAASLREPQADAAPEVHPRAQVRLGTGGPEAGEGDEAPA